MNNNKIINKPIKILVVDDDEDDFFLTKEYISDIKSDETYDVVWESNWDKALEIIKQDEFDIYFFDYLLGKGTGIELLKAALEIGCEQPIILLTGKGDKFIDTQAMEYGAYDYLVKSELNTEVLERSIRYAIKQAQIINALSESEQKYRSVFDKSKDMVFICSEDCKIVNVNDAASQYLGYSYQEFLNLKLHDLFISDEDKIRCLEILKTNGEIVDFETEIQDKNGLKKSCLISASTQIDKDMNPFYHGIIHDLTSRKKAEQNSLQSEKMSSANQLIRTLAHEVRNPLTNILLSIDTIENDLLNKELLPFVDIIKRNADRINNIISQLLNTSKPTANKVIKTNITEIIDEVMEEAKDRAELKKITIEKYYLSDCSVIAVDPLKIKIAIINIIINAIEAMPENEGVLELFTFSENNKCIMKIKDNGVGIPKYNLNKIFDPYHTSKSNGMGLGLAATMNILQSHNASIEVESEIGTGTTFTIYFELA